MISTGSPHYQVFRPLDGELQSSSMVRPPAGRDRANPRAPSAPRNVSVRTPDPRARQHRTAILTVGYQDATGPPAWRSTLLELSTTHFFLEDPGAAPAQAVREALELRLRSSDRRCAAGRSALAATAPDDIVRLPRRYYRRSNVFTVGAFAAANEIGVLAKDLAPRGGDVVGGGRCDCIARDRALSGGPVERHGQGSHRFPQDCRHTTAECFALYANGPGLPFERRPAP